MQSQIILASTSPFRKQLLEKLQFQFSTASPNVDETPLLNETAEQLVHRLAIAKAQAIAANNTSAIVIGSDQVAALNENNHYQILGKPGNYENAFQQLQLLSGKTVSFFTGLSVQKQDIGFINTLVDRFDVTFRILSNKEITAYLKAETPFNCAGSFKSEALGITLFKQLNGDDPNSLIGLPLIKLTEILIELDHHPLFLTK